MEKVKRVTTIFFLLEHFVDKTTFNSSHSTKLMKMLLLNMLLQSQYFSISYSNPSSGPNEKGMGKAQLSWYTKIFNKKRYDFIQFC